MNIRAIYENGVLKPLTPLGLSEQQIVEVQIQLIPSTPHVAKLGGIWREYSGGPAYEEIESAWHDAHQASMRGLLDQLDGKFNGG